MNQGARAELVEAIRSDRISNATQYADEFAARHNLNPKTVRSAISRLRRDLGVLKRQPNGSREMSAPGFVYSEGIDVPEGDKGSRRGGERFTPMRILIGEGAPSPELARLGAAVMARYAEDPEFRQAVDEHRPEFEESHQRVAQLRKMADELSEEERAEFLRLFAE